MVWVQRGNKRYYYRSIRDGKNIRKIYLGNKQQALCIAAEDEDRRRKREQAADNWKKEKERLLRIEAQVEQNHEIAIRYAQLIMHLAGYHQHDRGEWRKRRK